MKKNMLLAGTAAFVLAFLGACGSMDSVEGYTFRFKVENKGAGKVVKVEFFNGPNEYSLILRTVSFTVGGGLSTSNMSEEITVRGFTSQYQTDRRYCGVRITYEDGQRIFKFGHFGPESKILIYSWDYTSEYYPAEIQFYPGTW